MRPIVILLIILEIVRRVGFFANCFVELRYDPRFSILNPEASISRECYNRHILFPFGLLIGGAGNDG